MPAADSQTKAQDLLELYEPIFQWVCFVNRAGRKAAGACDYTEAREEIEGHLKGIREKALQDNYLARQEEKLKPPIVFFINSMVGASQLDIARQWMTDLLIVQGYEAARGNVHFFKLLEETLKVRTGGLGSVPKTRIPRAEGIFHLPFSIFHRPTARLPPSCYPRSSPRSSFRCR